NHTADNTAGDTGEHRGRMLYPFDDQRRPKTPLCRRPEWALRSARVMTDTDLIAVESKQLGRTRGRAGRQWDHVMAIRARGRGQFLHVCESGEVVGLPGNNQARQLR